MGATSVANMLWNFYHEIAGGDLIVARRGLQIISGIGSADSKAKFQPGRNPQINHPHFINVSWQQMPRNLSLGGNVFHPRAVAELTKAKFEQITTQSIHTAPTPPTLDGSVVENGEGQPASDQMLLFGIEKELENFLVRNWGAVFPDLEIYVDPQGRDGQQYPTEIGPIDILAIERQTGTFVVIELKRNRTSDTALGQVQRYMGWVKATLCDGNQKQVRGLIICGEYDPRLAYAMQVTQSIGLQYYKVSFELSSAPPNASESE